MYRLSGTSMRRRSGITLRSSRRNRTRRAGRRNSLILRQPVSGFRHPPFRWCKYFAPYRGDLKPPLEVVVLTFVLRNKGHIVLRVGLGLFRNIDDDLIVDRLCIVWQDSGRIPCQNRSSEIRCTRRKYSWAPRSVAAPRGPARRQSHPQSRFPVRKILRRTVQFQAPASAFLQTLTWMLWTPPARRHPRFPEHAAQKSGQFRHFRRQTAEKDRAKAAGQSFDSCYASLVLSGGQLNRCHALLIDLPEQP